MCEKEIYTETGPDGRVRTYSEPTYLCPNSRHGEYCDKTKEFRLPPGHRRSDPASPPHSYRQFPPTPPMSSHSENTSDSERSSKRRSGVYINGQKILDISRKRSLRHERNGSGDRGVYVDNSSLSRTPPLYQHSTPSSPITDVYDAYEPVYRETIVDERDRPTSSHIRPAIKVKITNERSPKGHHRHGSSSKTSSSRDSSGDERRQRRASDLHYEEKQRQQKLESEIHRQNEAIANRMPVPHAPASPRYRRGSVVVDPLVSMTERLRLDEEKARRRREKKEAEAREREIEAQKQRLKERMTPHRRNTLSQGERRPQVTYAPPFYP
ncbi:hypothetical protein F5Y19DRAFT_194679 [Xylariaceae sp. FL1651]|nr:hypothetical protein F5Y19DRAFT_194679 [Xylariaceae sp. FL1651]